ncbi:MAG TPA: acyl-CoA dehydrogenase family protein [Solirubrobacteraceae bacterium]|nr:acyl-CoA dehydrogenase family protein [Solirubrobacteraceae bacterium]
MSLTATRCIDEAQRLAPVFESQAAGSDAARRMLPEAIDELRASGLLGIVQPEAFGGAAQPFDTLVDVIAELAYGDASPAWVCANLFANSWLVSKFGQQAQEDVWQDDPTAAICGTLAPTGKVEVVEGGYRLSGRWEFGSGCHASQWGLFGGIAPHPSTGEQPTRLIFVVPRTEWTIVDTWFASGLRATGSNDIEMSGVFVPQHRAEPFALLNDGLGPGRDVAGAGLLPKLPLLVTWAYAVAAVPVGCSQRLVEDFAENCRAKLSQGAKASAGQSGPQLRLAEASAEVDTARLILRTDTRLLMEMVEAEHVPTVDERSRFRRNQTWAVTLAVRAADRCAAAMGSSILGDASVPGRRFRDIHASQAHHALVWDSPAENYGRVRLGLEPNAKIL